jgi:hypothetical protein
VNILCFKPTKPEKMKRTNPLFFLLVICSLPVWLSAQELKGKELIKSDDVNALVESGLGLLLGAKDITGEIIGAEVTADAPGKLTVKLRYEGFSNNWMKGSVVNAEKLKMDDILSEPVQLSSDGSEVMLQFELKDNPQEDNTTSTLLKILVCKRERDATGKVFAYQLDKTWKTSGLTEEEPVYDFMSEGELISITPQSVGSAAQLKDSQPNTLPKPLKTSKVKVNNTLYTSTVVRKPMMVQAAIAQPAAKSTSTPSTMKVKTFQGKFQPATMKKADMVKKEEQKPTFKIQPVLAQPLQLNQEQVDKGAKGPGNTAISLWDEIRSDVNFDFSSNGITNINTDIFPDKNEASGYYYYFPASYNLRWDKDEHYKLKILYGTATEGVSGQVNMFVQLTPGVGTLERQMVEDLVREYTDNNNLKFEKLLPVPLQEQPQVNLSGQLSSLYNIPAEKVSTSISGLFDPVDVAWPMNTKNADDLMVGLKEVDLNGTLKLLPQGEMPEINVPVRISLDDEQVLGRLDLKKNSWRTSEWKNEMPFPVKLKYIHALFLNEDEKGRTIPFIYSWSLSDQEVPVLAKVKFNAQPIPRVVDTKAHRLWVEYAVPACHPCKDKIIEELTGGTTTAREQQIEVVSYIKERINAYVVEVKVRSMYADTKGQQIIELPAVKLEEDGSSYYVGPLFVPSGKNLAYEYRLKVVTDEEVLQSEWIYSTESSLYLTKNLVEEALGKFPGE